MDTKLNPWQQNFAHFLHDLFAGLDSYAAGAVGHATFTLKWSTIWLDAALDFVP